MNDIDLIVSSVTVPLYVTLDKTIPLSWTVTNQGTNTAFADWYDNIYISDDQFLDEEDGYLTSSSAQDYTQGKRKKIYT